jgi:hypothetical protein
LDRIAVDPARRGVILNICKVFISPGAGERQQGCGMRGGTWREDNQNPPAASQWGYANRGLGGEE